MELNNCGINAAKFSYYYNSTVANTMRTEILELRSELNAATAVAANQSNAVNSNSNFSNLIRMKLIAVIN